MEALKLNSEVKKQIKQYLIELDNLKENRSRECDSLSDAENHDYDNLIKLTARIIRGLKRIESFL